LGRDASIAALDDAPGLVKLPFREGGAFEPHDDGDEHDSAYAAPEHENDNAEADHDHDTLDTHLWLDPMNAKAMAA
ncbi:zinc ABC transporter substrate-binding protein, partial [Rhizobium leguminosarum]